MATDDTPSTGRLRRPLAALSRLSRLGDVPVVVMLAWAGWLAVPWSFSGLAQARAAAAAAAADAETPRLQSAAAEQAHVPGRSHGLSVVSGASRASPPRADATQAQPPGAGQSQGRSVAWGIPAARTAPTATVRPWHAGPVAPPDETTTPRLDGADAAFPGAGFDGAGFDGARVDGARVDGARVDGARVDGARVDPARVHDARVDGADAEAAVVRERARIAGEVHDAAGHGLAAIAMQAGLALVTLDDDPEQARASLRAIRETSTTALAHLRAALDGIDPPAGDLAALIDGVRAAGLPVDVEPPAITVPTHLRSPVYRVVRESLTNVLRHAGPTRALVRASGDSRTFVVEVSDRGIGATGAGEGRGLAGMRARVSEAGGHLTASPREGGGFRVEARFPRVSA